MNFSYTNYRFAKEIEAAESMAIHEATREQQFLLAGDTSRAELAGGSAQAAWNKAQKLRNFCEARWVLTGRQRRQMVALRTEMLALIG